MITIRPAAPHELSVIAELAQRIWPTAYAGILTPEQIANILQHIYTTNNLADEQARGHRFWIAYEEDKAVGYASGYREEQVVWLKKVYVDPAAQGKGIGKRLMEAVEAAFRPASELRLLANPNNTPAHRFYLRQGFEKVGEVPVRMGDWSFMDFIFSRRIAA